MNEVWVTGIGIISSLGKGLVIHEKAIKEGATGIRNFPVFDDAETGNFKCGIISEEHIPQSINESASNRANLILDIALQEALRQAGLKGPLNADIYIGSTLGNMHGGSLYYNEILKNNDPDTRLLKNFLSFSITEFIAEKNKISGKQYSISTACASGNTSIGYAFKAIKNGLCDTAIAGGFDPLCPFMVAGFNSLLLVSKENCRPFDIDRKGLNPGEGAAILILENSISAKRRNIKPLAKITGFGQILEAYHHTRANPNGNGIKETVSSALIDAFGKIKPVDHIHFHGTATQANDTAEYNGLNRIYGNALKQIPACSTKPMTGHTFGAAGAIAAVFSIISVLKGIIPATLFTEKIDNEFGNLNILKKSSTGNKINSVITTALGFGGETSALVIEKANNGS